MAAVLKSLIIMITCFMFLEQFALPQEEDQFIFNGFNASNLRLNGIAMIHPNGLLQLTNTSKAQIGCAFFPFPFKFNKSPSNSSNSPSFSTTFVFAIVPEFTGPSGHGIAFTISPTMDLSGGMASQYLGLLNTSSNNNSSSHIFAVELDTIQNLEFEDIDSSHVGTDVNSLTSLESASAKYFAEDEGQNKSLDFLSGQPMQLWIDYAEAEKLLNVTLAPIRINKPSRPLLSTSIDLSAVLLDSMYVGFSSSTGVLASDHYILGWSFSKKGKARSLDYSKLPSLPPREKSKSKADLRIILPLITAVFLLVAISAAAAVYVIRSKKYEEIREDWEKEYGPQRFSYKDLYKATKGFKEKELLGSGGFGSVYQGVLPSSNEQVAVKRFSHDSKQGMRQFVAEIVSMGRLRHRNLVQLLGYCRRKGELLLVYDYMPNGSLDKFLFSNSKPNLSWVQRFRILKGVASALLYLHEEWEQVVLHRDIKPSNILLDANFNGRLGDFGLAKLYDHGTNPQTTRVVGTLGYIAPELARTGKATTSTDVFAFGTFMLEMACGRKPLDPRLEPEDTILADWVLELCKAGTILDASDARLEGNYVAEEIELVLRLGLLCSNPVAANRPSTRQLVQYLDGNITLPEIPLDGARIDTVTIEHKTSISCAASLPTSYGENSPANSFSSSVSIVSTGR